MFQYVTNQRNTFNKKLEMFLHVFFINWLNNTISEVHNDLYKSITPQSESISCHDIKMRNETMNVANNHTKTES